MKIALPEPELRSFGFQVPECSIITLPFTSVREDLQLPAPLVCHPPPPAQRSRRKYRDLSSEAGSEQVRCFRGLATKYTSKQPCWHSGLFQTLFGMEPCGWRSRWQELAFSLGDWFPGESLSAALPLCYHWPPSLAVPVTWYPLLWPWDNGPALEVYTEKTVLTLLMA